MNHITSKNVRKTENEFSRTLRPRILTRRSWGVMKSPTCTRRETRRSPRKTFARNSSPSASSRTRSRLSRHIKRLRRTCWASCEESTLNAPIIDLQAIQPRKGFQSITPFPAFLSSARENITLRQMGTPSNSDVGRGGFATFCINHCCHCKSRKNCYQKFRRHYHMLTMLTVYR